MMTYFSVSLICIFIISGCRNIRPPRGVDPARLNMEVTGYCSCGKCWEWERNWLLRPVFKSGPNKGKIKKVGITSSGKPARNGTIAADISLYPYGTVMYIPDYGYGIVEDTGRDIKGPRIDLYFNTHRAARNWGRNNLPVKVWRKAQ